MSLEFRDPDLLHDLMMTISGSIGKEGNHKMVTQFFVSQVSAGSAKCGL